VRPAYTDGTGTTNRTPSTKAARPPAPAVRGLLRRRQPRPQAPPRGHAWLRPRLPGAYPSAHAYADRDCDSSRADEIARAFDHRGPESVAAVLIEPINGTTGGAFVPPDGPPEPTRPEEINEHRTDVVLGLITHALGDRPINGARTPGTVHDPQAVPTAMVRNPELDHTDDLVASLDGADLVVLAIERPQYRQATPHTLVNRPANPTACRLPDHPRPRALARGGMDRSPTRASRIVELRRRHGQRRCSPAPDLRC
jgi:hypothetical protein